MSLRSASDLIWHPHQKLWNHRLTACLRRIPGGRIFIACVVLIDTLLLIFRTVARRARLTGVIGLVRAPALPHSAVYIDLGLHKDGHELRYVSEWFDRKIDLRLLGFEASKQHFAEAASALADVNRAELHQLALVGPEHQGDTIQLFKAGASGRGDSLYSNRGQEYDEVPARRLSQFLSAAEIDVRNCPVLLRMNVEGAEWYVIQDLVAAGLDDQIDGYFGMWDDLSKIDPSLDERFRSMLDERGIITIPFNERDTRVRMRRWAIRYDMISCLSAHTTSAVSRNRSAEMHGVPPE